MYHRNLAHLNPYELHKHLINEYMLTKPGATKLLQRDTSRDKTDHDVVRENHRFLWDGETVDSWEKQLAKKYYDKLFKEYCIADLSRYKENKVAMRWRIEKEVIVGKGQFVCGDRQCEDRSELRSWEVNFGYLEQGQKKNALVKLRLCPKCSDKLNYHSKKREIKRLKKRDRKSKTSGSKSVGDEPVPISSVAKPTTEGTATETTHDLTEPEERTQTAVDEKNSSTVPDVTEGSWSKVITSCLHSNLKKMNTYFICVIVSLLAFADGQDGEKELECPGGYCMSKYLCPNGTFIDDKKLAQDSNLIGLRTGIEIDDIDSCEHYLLKCCLVNSPVNPTTPDPVLDDDLIEPPPSRPECGQFNEGGLFYNMQHNDSLAQFAEFPWVVYIIQEEKLKPESDFVCGGTLINTRFVLTTAHNTEWKSHLIARFGEWDIGTTNEPYAHKEINVGEIIKHPQYVRNPIENDIALLYLVKDVRYERHIQPICLPQPNDDFVGERCISSGWGVQRGVYAKVMKKITLPVIATRECSSMLRLGGLPHSYTLPNGFMCAGAEQGVDMCKGDGGSPLACKREDGAYVLTGIVSWGIGCGGFNLPGVYVDVRQYLNWISEQCTNGVCVQRAKCPTGTYDETNAQDLGIIGLRFDDDVCQAGEVCCQSVSNYQRWAIDRASLESVFYSLQVGRRRKSSTEYECGVHNPNGIPNGVQVDIKAHARYGEYPWVVAIYQWDKIYGGGTLIHPLYVVSAAHIFKTTDNFVARFGEWDLERKDNPLPKQVNAIRIRGCASINITNIIYHPEHQSDGLRNDIALARLQEAVRYDDHIRPICLPSATAQFDNQLCTATGWGMNTSNMWVSLLKRVELPIVPRAKCKQLFAATRLGPFFRLHQSVLCAGSVADVDMCQGDGGSGLFCPTESGTFVLAGIVSWGLSCHQQGVPGAYVNVAKFVPWIESTIEEHK
uniref:Peptidase S1 domain-containing protein n=1 Tax=Anopheles minimus TaxID=112268 RepID=A0A182WFT5_9DIPT